MLRNDELATVRIRGKLKIAVKEWVETDYAQSLGFSSISNFMTIAAREALMKYKGPTFTDMVRYETHYELYDNVIHKKVEVSINIGEAGLECTNCDSFKCDHVLFIWNSKVETIHLKQLKFLDPFLYLFNTT